MLRDEAPVTPLAGCTDVYVNLQFGTLADTRFLDVWPLAELRFIEADRDTLRIGALTTYTEIDRFRAGPPAPAHARRGGARDRRAADPESRHARRQHRQRLAGRRFACRCWPPPTPSSCCAARATSGACPSRRFYTGYRATVRRPDELIVAVEIPRVHGTQYWRKVGTRRAQAISKVMCAGVRGDEVRVALGSVGPTVVRLRKTERVLSAGGTLKQAQARAARRNRRPSTTSGPPPIIDARSAPTCWPISGGRPDSAAPRVPFHAAGPTRASPHVDRRRGGVRAARRSHRRARRRRPPRAAVSRCRRLGRAPGHRHPDRAMVRPLAVAGRAAHHGQGQPAARRDPGGDRGGDGDHSGGGRRRRTQGAGGVRARHSPS